MVAITVNLTDAQVAHARSVLPDGTTAAQAKAELESIAAFAIGAQVWAWAVESLREQANDVRKTRRAEHDALFPPDEPEPEPDPV